MSAVHEKYLTSSSNQRQTKRNKKKSTTDEGTQSNIYAPNDKERVHIVTSLINRLKTELNTIDAAIGKLIWIFHGNLDNMGTSVLIGVETFEVAIVTLDNPKFNNQVN